ncbi:MAG: hypothetical protein Q9219_004190 [cf. Caloplaca sp. 3 TL-2023]
MAQSQVSTKKQQDLQQQYTTYKNNLQQLAEKIGNVEQETEEHKLVLETLGPLPGNRKCFRMINGVLVETTVTKVLPALQTNSDGLKKVLEELVKQYKRQQDDMEKWKHRAPKETPNPHSMFQTMLVEFKHSDLNDWKSAIVGELAASPIHPSIIVPA